MCWGRPSLPSPSLPRYHLSKDWTAYASVHTAWKSCSRTHMDDHHRGQLPSRTLLTLLFRAKILIQTRPGVDGLGDHRDRSTDQPTDDRFRPCNERANNEIVRPILVSKLCPFIRCLTLFVVGLFIRHILQVTQKKHTLYRMLHKKHGKHVFSYTNKFVLFHYEIRKQHWFEPDTNANVESVCLFPARGFSIRTQDQAFVVRQTVFDQKPEAKSTCCDGHSKVCGLAYVFFPLGKNYRFLSNI